VTTSFSFQPSQIPGREGAPAAPQPAQGTPPPPAGADGGAAGPPGGLSQMLFLALPLVFFFLLWSQSRKQKQVEKTLKAGDRVILQSGFVGKIVDLGATRAKIELAPGVNVQVLKSAIQGLDGGEPKPESSDPKAKEPAKEPAKDKAQEKKA
jgi:preprotein translocase subunit YajC